MPEPSGDASNSRTRTSPVPAPAATPGTVSGSTAPQNQVPLGMNPDDCPAFGPPAQPGDLGKLGRYRVLKRLGVGGMGAVYLGLDETLGRRLALKVMLPRFAANPTARHRFLREARTAASIRSDHVVAVIDVDETNGIPFIAMDYLEGLPLDRYLAAHPGLNISQVIRVGQEVARGLAAAHELGLVHRDIKPANLFLEAPYGRVKIVDFGLAREEEEAGTTRTGDVVGTPSYMSPEQARGERVDHRTDLFSLGVVLYKLCTGRLPFRGRNTMAILMALGMEDPPPVRELNPEVPQELSDLIARLLAKKAADRPQSATEVHGVLAALEGAATPSGVMPAVPSPEEVERPEVAPIAVDAQPEGAEWGWTDDPIEATPSEPSAETARPVAKRRSSVLWLIVGCLLVLGLAGGLLAAILARYSNRPTPEPEVEQPPPVRPDPTAFFNEKDFAGWLGKPGHWRIEDGALVGSFPTGVTPATTFLYSRRLYGDFELSCKVKLSADTPNTGIVFRGRVHDPVAFDLVGPECELSPSNLGGLYRKDLGGPLLTAPAEVISSYRPNAYNDLTIRCFGRRVTITVNGKVSHDAEVEIPAEGVIGFQLHPMPGGGTKGVIFREIKFTDLGTPNLAADRKVADWVLFKTGKVYIDGGSKPITSRSALPTTLFRLTGIEFPANTYKLTDADIEHLQGLGDLVSFTAPGNTSSLTNDGVRKLADLPISHSLTTLSLASPAITDTGLAQVPRFTALVDLNLSRTKTSVDGLAKLRELKRLRRLSIGHRPITAADLEAVRGLPLETLNLNQTGLTNEAVAVIGKMTELQVLNLQGNRALTNTALEHLMKLPKLRTLNLSGTGVTSEAVSLLQNSMPNCLILHYTDRTIAAELQRLGAELTYVTAKEVPQLLKPADPLPKPQFTLTHVRFLESKPSTVSAARVAELLAELPGLTNFYDQNKHIRFSDDDVIRLSQGACRETLRNFDGYCLLTPRLFEALLQFPNLSAVHFDASDADDALLERLPELKSLKTLNTRYLGRSGTVSAKGLTAITRMPLRNLALTHLRLTPQLLETLAAGLPTVEYLVIDFTKPVDDYVPVVVKNFPNLKSLVLAESSLGDKSLALLEAKTKLTQLNVRKTPVSEAAVADLKLKLPNCKILSEFDPKP